MTERLQKLIARSGLCSRRAAEALLTEGRVTVNGAAARLGDKADPETDAIAVDGKPLTFAEPMVYLMLNKPRGYVTTLSDELGRATAAQLVADCGARVGYTLSSVPANASYSLSSGTRSPPQTTAGSPVVCPIQSAPSGTAVHSSRNAPCIGANSMSGSDTPSSVKPTPLPKHILAAASAT